MRRARLRRVEGDGVAGRASGVVLMVVVIVVALVGWVRGGGLDGARAVTGAGGGVRVDVNGASVAELEALPGVGPSLAGRIVAERERRGGFRRVEELDDVRGIGETTLERLRGVVTVGGVR